MLQGQAFGLGDEEVGVDEAADAEGAPDEEDFCAEVAFVGADHVGGYHCYDLLMEWGVLVGGLVNGEGEGKTYAVPEPVAGCSQGDTAGADGQRVDFTDDDPRAGAPRRRKEEDVNADERNLRPDGVWVLAVDRAGDRDDELAHQHAEGAPDEQGAAAEALDRVEGDWGGADVHEGGHQADEEGVLDRAELLEEGRAEVEDEVDSCDRICHVSTVSE